MSEVKFPNGMSVKAPHEKAPDFVKGQVSIKKQLFLEWLTHQEGEWVNLDIKVGQSGKWYMSVNDWKPKEKVDEYRANGTVPDNGFTPPPAPEDDLPF